MAISAPARSIDATATSTSQRRMTARIGRSWTSTSNIDSSSVSGSMPWDIVRLPCGSMSMHRTRWPSSAKAAARFSVVVVFATPPFWLAKAITLAGVTSCSDRREPIRASSFAPDRAIPPTDRVAGKRTLVKPAAGLRLRAAASGGEQRDVLGAEHEHLARDLLGLAPGVGEGPVVDDRAERVADRAARRAGGARDLARGQEAVEDADRAGRGRARGVVARRAGGDRAHLARGGARASVGEDIGLHALHQLRPSSGDLGRARAGGREQRGRVALVRRLRLGDARAVLGHRGALLGRLAGRVLLLGVVDARDEDDEPEADDQRADRRTDPDLLPRDRG